MSEMTRPEPASAELAERARPGYRSLADDIASEVGYWAPETLTAAGLGLGGLLLWHPAALPIAGLLLAARIAAAKRAYRRQRQESDARWQKQRAELAARRATHDRSATEREESA